MKTRTTETKAIVALAAIGAVVFIFCRSAAVEIVYPVERARSVFASKVWSRVVGMFKAAEANAENVKLRREVASLAMLRGDIERLEVENARLRGALEFAAKRPEMWMAAEVLSVDGAAARTDRSLRVDKGALDGVMEGAAVMAPEGLVGRVTSVTPHTSEITLVVDASVKVACETDDTGGNRLSGILCGGEGGLLKLRYLSGNLSVSPRTRLLTSGLGGVFPRGYEVGTLVGVRKTGDDTPPEGEVLPLVEFRELEYVFIRREK